MQIWLAAIIGLLSVIAAVAILICCVTISKTCTTTKNTEIRCEALYNSTPGDNPDFVVVIYESERYSNTRNLIRLLKHHGYPFKVLGLGERWNGWYGRNLAHKTYIETLSDETFVLFLDGRDVVANIGYAKFRQRAIELFERKGRKIIMGAENTLWMGFMFPEIGTPESFEKIDPRFVPATYNLHHDVNPTYNQLIQYMYSIKHSNGMFPNYGMSFGTVGLFKKMFEAMGLGPGEDDQGAAIKLWTDPEYIISIDFEEILFLNLLPREGHQLRWDWGDREFKRYQKNSVPSFIHFPARNHYYQDIVHQSLNITNSLTTFGRSPKSGCIYNCCRILSYPSIQVVVSRYAEDVSWTKDLFYSEEVVIYNKGSPLTGTIPLPNLGRDFHTYFFHIVENYSNLADITFFVPGSAFSEPGRQSKMRRVLNTVRKTRTSAIVCYPTKNDIGVEFNDFKIDQYAASNAQNFKSNPETYLRPAKYRPFGNWYKNKFPVRPETKFVAYSGIFAIHKQHIQQHGIEIYRELCRDLQDHTNPEDLHYIERAVPAIFSPLPTSCYLVAK